jgi:L-histidine N-alpha-methyltransferase
LHRAYYDSKGVTSRFNYNLLTRMNRELGANFDLKYWQHRASWNANVGAMESWLVPTEDQTVTFGEVAKHATFSFNAWEGIRVERSYKYSKAQIVQFAEKAGFKVVKLFIENGFCEALFVK